MPEFVKSQTELRKVGQNITKAQLDAVCDVCVQAYVNLIREYADEFKNVDDFAPNSAGNGMQLSGAGPSVQDDGKRPSAYG